MAFTIKDARGVCTATELELVKMSRSPEMKRQTPARIRQKIDRARKLRDKFRDEAARQSREARGKAAPRGTRAAEGNERTVLKAEIFADVLQRLEAMLSGAEKMSEKKAATDAPSKKKSGSKVTSAGKSTAKKATTKDAERTSKKSGSKATAKDSKKTAKADKTSPKAATEKKAPTASSKAASAANPPTLGAMKTSRKAPGRTNATASLSGLGTAGSSSSAFGSTGAAAASRNTRRREHHERSAAERVESRFAATAKTRLKGHVAAQTKRAQAKRDSGK